MQNAELGRCCARREPRVTKTVIGFGSLPVISSIGRHGGFTRTLG